MKKNLQSLVKAAAENLANIELLNAEIRRFEEAAAAPSLHLARLSELKNKRAAEFVSALVERREADVGAIDNEIADAEIVLATVEANAEAAIIALAMVRSRIESEESLIDVARGHMVDTVATVIVAQHDDAQERYFKAIETMREAAEEMVACDKTWSHVLTPETGKPFPCRGAQVLSDVRAGGLRVNWKNSLLREPEIAAQYLAGFEDGYFTPWWADVRNTSFAETATVNSVAALRSAGYACAPYAPPAVAVSEQRVAVQIIRGSVPTSTIKINAISGAQVTVAGPTVIAGGTLTLASSEAAAMVVNGMAKYVDGRSLADAYRLLHPNSPLPAHVQPPAFRASGKSDEIEVTVRQDSAATGEYALQNEQFLNSRW